MYEKNGQSHKIAEPNLEPVISVELNHPELECVIQLLTTGIDWTDRLMAKCEYSNSDLLQLQTLKKVKQNYQNVLSRMLNNYDTLGYSNDKSGVREGWRK